MDMIKIVVRAVTANKPSGVGCCKPKLMLFVTIVIFFSRVLALDVFFRVESSLWSPSRLNGRPLVLQHEKLLDEKCVTTFFPEEVSTNEENVCINFGDDELLLPEGDSALLLLSRRLKSDDDDDGSPKKFAV